MSSASDDSPDSTPIVARDLAVFWHPCSQMRDYRDLPPLAGICPLIEAIRPGLSVEECVRRLKRYHYSFKRLHQIYTARITAEPIYELKMGFSLHAHLCAGVAQ